MTSIRIHQHPHQATLATCGLACISPWTLLVLLIPEYISWIVILKTSNNFFSFLFAAFLSVLVDICHSWVRQIEGWNLRPRQALQKAEVLPHHGTQVGHEQGSDLFLYKKRGEDETPLSSLLVHATHVPPKYPALKFSGAPQEVLWSSSSPSPHGSSNSSSIFHHFPPPTLNCHHASM